MTHALVVDDEPAICRCFETLFAKLGCRVTVAASAERGLELAAETGFDVVVLDVRLPGMDGLSALPEFRKIADVPILVITAHGDLTTAVTSIEGGAFDYLPKPFDLDAVTTVLRRAIDASQAPAAGRVRVVHAEQAPQMIGDSQPMQHLFRQIALAARHDEPVLITGESGVGKELVAHAIHKHSARSGRAIVPVHLASLSGALMERELFGHTAGAYTGAAEAQEGLIARADGGSLFLDEIGETPHAVQVKLLRTIETREYYRVGSSTSESSDFRLIAATNRPIDFLRSADTFRADLFYRLSTIHIHVPPLRERAEDIPVLAAFLLNQGCDETPRSFSEEALAKLRGHAFPGNVRELKNVVLRAAAESSEACISAEFIQLDDAVEGTAPKGSHGLADAAREWVRSALEAGDESLLGLANAEIEREIIAAVLEHCDGNRSAAATILGIHRETLRDKLSKYDVGGSSP